jgi:hypothetical protein
MKLYAALAARKNIYAALAARNINRVRREKHKLRTLRETNKKMRILQLIDTLSAGGAERMAVNISNVLADNGYEVWLCASRTGGALEYFVDEKVNYLQLAKKHGLDIAAFFRLVKLIRKNKITLIHAHSSSVFWAVAAKVFCPGLKVIWHDHLGKRIEEES